MVCRRAAVVLCGSADGYISNTCVDIDYEAVKRTLLQRRIDPLQLPPPPPDPPQMSNTMESYPRDRCRTRCIAINQMLSDNC